ncbi:MAG: phosphoribosylglycinamide formyltransferase [Verrucomicrobia bacterium]|nr:phosphoribosylglycinamide formyltransferase [Verrucomicrobiota bacterium]
MRRLRLGVLGSGRGSNFVALAEAVKAGQVAADFVLVGSDQADAKILDVAKERGVRTWVCAKGKYRTHLEAEIERELANQLREAGADLVVLAGYMRVVKAPLLETFSGAMINIHPSLLPAFPGLKAWEQAWRAGVKETGCTVHWVNEVVDGGSVIRQGRVEVRPGESAEELHQRIQAVEHRLLPEVVGDLAAGKIPWGKDPRT